MSGAAGRTALAPAMPGDEPELRRLLRETPLSGAIALTFEREPDWHRAAAVEGDRHDVLVGRRSERVVGFAARAVRDVFVDGAPARLGYLGGLRIEPGARGELRLLREGFAWFAAARRPDELPFDLTSIVVGNVRARRLLEAGLPGLPAYRPLGELVTLALRARPARRPAPAVARGSRERLPEIAAFLQREGARCQLAPRLAADLLTSPSRARALAPEDFLLVEKSGAIRAAGAVWDQRTFKQTVVRSYAPALRLLRPVLVRCGIARLPAEGAPFASAFLAFAHASGDDAAAFAHLLDAALDEGARRGLDALVLGLAADHPLLDVARRRRHWEYRSILYAVHFADGDERVAALDRRPLGPEVSIL
jgi:hypothetical protein